MAKILWIVGYVIIMCTLDQFVRLARWPFRALFWIVCSAIVFCHLTGCAALPMPLQPQNSTYNSNAAEGTWLVLDAVDTAQTMHIRASNPTCSYEADPFARFIYRTAHPSPSRVLLTNLALATVHTMVTSWLDDEVAKHAEADDDNAGLWYVGRAAWLGVSILGTGFSVVNNFEHGCPL